MKQSHSAPVVSDEQRLACNETLIRQATNQIDETQAMVLRVMQITVPESTNEILDQLLEGREVLVRWRDSDSDQITLHLLVPADESLVAHATARLIGLH